MHLFFLVRGPPLCLLLRTEHLTKSRDQGKTVFFLPFKKEQEIFFFFHSVTGNLLLPIKLFQLYFFHFHCQLTTRCPKVPLKILKTFRSAHIDLFLILINFTGVFFMSLIPKLKTRQSMTVVVFYIVTKMNDGILLPKLF